MSLRRVVLLRHGETDDNARRRIQGHLDVGLNATGRKQARQVAPVLAGFAPERVLTSDLRRAADTAEEVAATCGLTAKPDPRLRETHLGDWQGLTHPEVEQGWPGRLDLMRSDPTWAPPGGESRVQLARRALPVVTEVAVELAREPGEETVLCCAHGGLICALTARLLGLALVSWPALAGMGNCRWAVLEWADTTATWRLTGYNVGLADPLDP